MPLERLAASSVLFCKGGPGDFPGAAAAEILHPDLPPPGGKGLKQLFDSMGTLLSTFLPGLERPVAELQTAVERLGRLLPARFTVRQADGALLAAVGDPLPAPPSKILLANS